VTTEAPDAYTDQQLRAIASALRARGALPDFDGTRNHRADELDAAAAIEQLYRERGAMAARLDCVARAVHDLTHDADGVEISYDLPVDEVRRVLGEALTEVPW